MYKYVDSGYFSVFFAIFWSFFSLVPLEIILPTPLIVTLLPLRVTKLLIVHY